MNKTIKQRAVKCCMTNFPSHDTADAESMRIGYIKGAEEQKAIDLREFADCLTEMQGEYITLELINNLVWNELNNKD